MKQEIKNTLDTLRQVNEIPTAIIVKSQSIANKLGKYGFYLGYPVYVWTVMEDEFSILTK